MLIRPLREDEKELYNQVVDHPVQSWEWGSFRAKTGKQIERIGFFDQSQLKRAIQVSFHPLPWFGWSIGYAPRGFMPDEEQLAALRQLGKKHQALFIKIEPNVAERGDVPSAHPQIKEFLAANNVVPSKGTFFHYTFYLDLTKSIAELFEKLNQKTRYNVNIASKKGVQVVEASNEQGLETYLEILHETTTRNAFYLHSDDYFRTMWQTLGPSGMMRIFHAVYEGKVLVAWVMFMFNGVLYYPYGASRSLNREVMASNLMLWEMIQFGKNSGCHLFDLWGCLGPTATEKDPWFGFHRFKKGYGGELMGFLGSFDLVIDHRFYGLFNLIDNLRWKFLRLRAKLKR